MVIEQRIPGCLHTILEPAGALLRLTVTSRRGAGRWGATFVYSGTEVTWPPVAAAIWKIANDTHFSRSTRRRASEVAKSIDNLLVIRGE